MSDSAMVVTMNGLLKFLVILCVSVTVTFSTHLADGVKENGEYILTLRMPSVVSNAPDTLMCTGMKLEPEESYIVKYNPHASQKTAHHLMVYGCNSPASQDKAWRCDESDHVESEHSVCGDGEDRQILFAWALDAPAKSLPDGVGFRVAGSTKVKYIVVQLHYARAFSDGETDESGVTLQMTRTRPPQQMGYFVLGNSGSIQPLQHEVHIENACEYEGAYPIYPIGYRTHAHSLGVVTAGYRIRNGQWTEIGRMSPQLPQTFYPVTNPGMDIRSGDILAARCTMNSMSRTNFIQMGPAHKDEMCNFYIMYSTYNPENLATNMCFSPTPDFSWDKYLTEYLPAPSNASSLDGIPRAHFIRRNFNMTL